MVMVVNQGNKDDILQASTPRFGPSVAKFIRDLCWWRTANVTFLETGILEVKAVLYTRDLYKCSYILSKE